jgi:hypothetical protein
LSKSGFEIEWPLLVVEGTRATRASARRRPSAIVAVAEMPINEHRLKPSSCGTYREGQNGGDVKHNHAITSKGCDRL